MDSKKRQRGKKLIGTKSYNSRHRVQNTGVVLLVYSRRGHYERGWESPCNFTLSHEKDIIRDFKFSVSLFDLTSFFFSKVNFIVVM